MLEENRIEELAQRELERIAAENMEHMTKCFVENLDKNQLFERLFSNDKHKQQIETHEIEIDHIIVQYRLVVLKQTEKICDLARDNYNIRSQEIGQYEEACADSRNAAQSEGIEMIDNFLKERNDLIDQAKCMYCTLAEIVKHNASDSAKKIAECESLYQKYEILIDNVWYSLMEQETTLHERIEEIQEYLSSNITTIVDQFVDNVQQLFAVVRIASEEYFKMIEEKILANQINDEQLNKFCALDCAQHLAVIDRREADVVFQAKKWLSMHLDKYKRFVQ